MYFENIPVIPYEGPASTNPLAFKFYNPDQLVLGKPMKEHLPFAMAWWHNLCAAGTDMFGRDTADKSFGVEKGTMEHAKAKVDAGFEFMQKLGIEYFCFHDVDIVRTHRNTDAGTGNRFLCGVDDELCAIVCQNARIIVNAHEDNGMDGSAEHAFRFGNDIDVFRTDNDFDGFVIAETSVETFKFASAEVCAVVAFHSAVEDVAFADEVRNEAVFRFVVDIFGCADLLDHALIDNGDRIGHGHGFFLIVRDVDKGDAELLLHSLEFELHIFSEFEVKCAKRFI